MHCYQAVVALVLANVSNFKLELARKPSEKHNAKY